MWLWYGIPVLSNYWSIGVDFLEPNEACHPCERRVSAMAPLMTVLLAALCRTVPAIEQTESATEKSQWGRERTYWGLAPDKKAFREGFHEGILWLCFWASRCCKGPLKVRPLFGSQWSGPVGGGPPRVKALGSREARPVTMDSHLTR